MRAAFFRIPSISPLSDSARNETKICAHLYYGGPCADVWRVEAPSVHQSVEAALPEPGLGWVDGRVFFFGGGGG